MQHSEAAIDRRRDVTASEASLTVNLGLKRCKGALEISKVTLEPVATRRSATGR